MNIKYCLLLILFLLPISSAEVTYGDGYKITTSESISSVTYGVQTFQKWNEYWLPMSEANILTGDWSYAMIEDDNFYMIVRDNDIINLPKEPYISYTFGINRISFAYTLTVPQFNTIKNKDGVNWFIQLPEPVTKSQFIWDDKKPIIYRNGNRADSFTNDVDHWYTKNNGLRFYLSPLIHAFVAQSDNVTFEFDSWIVEGSIGGGGWTNVTMDTNTKIRQCSGGLTLQDVVSDYISKWDLCSGSGNLAPDENTTSNNDGTISNGAWNTSGGLDFNGASTLINVGSDAELDDITRKTIVVDFYLKGWGENGVGVLAQKSGYSLRIRNVTQNPNFLQGFSTNDGVWKWGTHEMKLASRYQGSTAYDKSSSSTNPIFIFQNTSLWSNTSVYTSNPSDVPVGTASSDALYDMTIGNRVSLDYTFNGTIYSVTLFNRLLNQTQVNQTLNGNKQTKGNITILYDSVSGNRVNVIEINATTPTNTNYSLYYANASTLSYTRVGTNFIGNATIAINTTTYANVSIKIELFGNVTAAPEVQIVSFTSIVNTAPTTPSIIVPTNMSTHYNNSINISWAVNDTNNDTITSHYQLSTTPLFTTVSQENNITINYTGSISTVNGNRYYIRVRGYDNTSWGNWSDTYQFLENTEPVISDITLLPVEPTNTSNLTVTMNGTDDDSHAITPHFMWYKAGIINQSWDNYTSLVNAGNLSYNDTIYVKGYYNDGFQNSTQSQSITVRIGSGQSAPSLPGIPGISLSSNTRKWNKTIWVNTTNPITDSDGDQVIFQVYYYNDTTRVYFSNSSYLNNNSNSSINITIPWSDATNRTIYGSAIDNTSLESEEQSVVFIPDTAAPVVTSVSTSPSSITAGGSVTISVNASCTQTTGYSDCEVSSLKLKVLNPNEEYGTGNDGLGNRTATLTNGVWTYIYSLTTTVGTYTIDHIYFTDDSGVSAENTTTRTFTSTAVVVSGSGGGGGGGSVVITPSPLKDIGLQLQNITTIKSTSDLSKIGECLSTSLLLTNTCAQSTISIVTDPINWWTLIGSYLGTTITIFSMAFISDKRDFITNIKRDTIYYGSIAWILVIVLSFVGVNMFILNYAFESSKPGLMFGSFIIWGVFTTIFTDYYKSNKRKVFNIS